MTDLVLDIASHQTDNVDFYRQFINQGVRAGIIKLTEGTGYINPKANNQIQAFKQLGLRYHGYHYLKATTVDQAIAEANFFVQTAKKLGLDKTSIMVCDVEDGVLPNNKSLLTDITNSFLRTVQANGFEKIDTYASRSWFTDRLDKSKLISTNSWVASYGSNSAGIECGTWQFTDKFNGLNLDCSFDYNGFYTKLKEEPATLDLNDFSIPVPFAAKGLCIVENKAGAQLYEDAELTKPTATILPYGSAWQIFGAGDGGVFGVGGYINQGDAIAKFNRGLGSGNYRGMVAVIATDDCFTQALPESNQPGIEHKLKGDRYKIINQSDDLKYVDLGFNQWVATEKLNVEL